MADSIWYGQKASASTFVQQALADGQAKPVSDLVAGLRQQGISAKNAMKALYAETVNGNAVLTGEWSDGTIQKGNA